MEPTSSRDSLIHFKSRQYLYVVSEITSLESMFVVFNVDLFAEVNYLPTINDVVQKN